MELGTPNSEVVNMTRAIEAVAPMLNHPRRTIVRVEALVLVAAALLLLRFIFVLKLCDKAMFPLTLYILSTMQASPIKNSVYPVWAVSLIMASEATGAAKKPGLPTMENMLSFWVEVARFLYYLTSVTALLDPVPPNDSLSIGHPFLIHRKYASSPCTLVLFIFLFLFLQGIFVYILKFFGDAGGLMFGFYYSHGVAEWTKKNLKNDDQSDGSPKSMNDYNYLVRHTFINDNVTTIDQIWVCFQDSDDKKILKDVCLSFALFQLLKRRYYEWNCAEAGYRNTQDFVFKVLLPHPENDYKRAFRVVETELGLCYDFLFTKYELMYATGLWSVIWMLFFVLSLTELILSFVIGGYALKNSLFLETPSPIIEVHNTKSDYIISLAFLSIILMVKLLEAAFYLASDWVKVSLACMYVKRKSSAPIEIILEIIIRFLCKINISAGCRNTIGHCSFLSDLSYPTFWNEIRTPAVKVSDAVEKAIAISLISSDGELTKGERALRKHEMFEEYSWTLKDHSQIEVMMIWHIATDYCYLALSGNGEDRNVAVNLSRYYAYLIAFVPSLLPYHVADIRELIFTVRQEIVALQPRRSMYQASYTPLKMYNRIKDLEGNDTSVFMKGLKLGKQLASMSNGAQRWKMLAEFWAESIIYITPWQFNTRAHMEHLESGGEFLTKIWVLLFHAGILTLDREKDRGPKPAQPQTA